MGKLVGRYIHRLREQQGISIRQLSSQIDMSHSHLSLIERGEREMSITVLYPIVQALKGDFVQAIFLLAQDAGVPEDVVSCKP